MWVPPRSRAATRDYNAATWCHGKTPANFTSFTDFTSVQRSTSRPNIIQRASSRFSSLAKRANRRDSMDLRRLQAKELLEPGGGNGHRNSTCIGYGGLGDRGPRI